MTTTNGAYARTQADGYDNIAPTTLQGQQAWQYAQSDNFLSAEEASAVMRQQLEPYRAQIEAKLSQIGFPPDHLASYPKLEQDLFSGRTTDRMNVLITPDLKMEGVLRIVMTEHGPDLRITPVQPQLTIPQEINGVLLSKSEQQQLLEDRALPRPLLMPEKGEYVPTFLRVNEVTNTVELWRIKPEELPTKLMGTDLTKDQQLQLTNGYPVRLSGLLDQQGEPFNATVSISPAKQSFEFADVSRLALGVKPDQEFRQQLAQNNEGAKTDLTRSREVAIGSPTISNHQAEVIKEMLEKPEQERSVKLPSR